MHRWIITLFGGWLVVFGLGCGDSPPEIDHDESEYIEAEDPAVAEEEPPPDPDC